MTIELNREAIAQVAALPAVAKAAEVGSELIALWPLTEAMQMDNDAKYAENLQVRITPCVRANPDRRRRHRARRRVRL